VDRCAALALVLRRGPLRQHRGGQAAKAQPSVGGPRRLVLLSVLRRAAGLYPRPAQRPGPHLPRLRRPLRGRSALCPRSGSMGREKIKKGPGLLQTPLSLEQGSLCTLNETLTDYVVGAPCTVAHF